VYPPASCSCPLKPSIAIVSHAVALKTLGMALPFLVVADSRTVRA
jgi:hypothetical protein